MRLCHLVNTNIYNTEKHVTPTEFYRIVRRLSINISLLAEFKDINPALS